MLYVSVADPGLEQADIDNLVDQARADNLRNKLTGALFYNGQNFLQLLEGPDDAVEACLNRIRTDIRHSGMIELRRRALGERDFSEWAMFHSPQFRPPDDSLARLARSGHLDAQDSKIIEAFLSLGKTGPSDAKGSE